MSLTQITQFGQPQKFIEDDRTFFCSELVAKAYKAFGIIRDDGTSCTKFFPK